MKYTMVIALIACGTTIQSSARADFLGLQLVDVSNWFSTVGPLNYRNDYNSQGGPNSYRIYRLFAMFDSTGVVDPDNRVNLIFGLPGSPWSLTLHNGSLLNHVEFDPPDNFVHNNLAPVNNLGSPPIIGWETWATVGTQNMSNPQFFSPGAHSASQLNNFTPGFSADNSSLGFTPDDIQGNAIALNSTSSSGQGIAGFGVLLMQITVTPGSLFSGRLNIQIGGSVNNGGSGATERMNLVFTNVPTPSTFALLCVASFGGLRRRRRN